MPVIDKDKGVKSSQTPALLGGENERVGVFKPNAEDDVDSCDRTWPGVRLGQAIAGTPGSSARQTGVG